MHSAGQSTTCSGVRRRTPPNFGLERIYCIKFFSSDYDDDDGRANGCACVSVHVHAARMDGRHAAILSVLVQYVLANAHTQPLARDASLYSTTCKTPYTLPKK